MPISNSENEASGVGSKSSTYQKPQASEQISDNGPRTESPPLSSGAQDGAPTAEVSSTSSNNQEVDGQVMNIALQKDEPQDLGDGTNSQDVESLPTHSKSDLILNTEETGDGDKKNEEPENAKDMIPGKRAEDAAKKVMEYSQYIQLMETRLATLEIKMGIIGAEEKKIEITGSTHKRVPAIPELRRVTWTEFKNQIKDNKKIYAVEALVGEAKYYYQRNKQQRQSVFLTNSGDTPNENPQASSGRASVDQKDRIDRIRINSVPILMLLADISDLELPLEPTVHLRPFKFLARHDKGIRERLAILESRWSAQAKEQFLPPQNGRSATDDTEKADFGLLNDSKSEALGTNAYLEAEIPAVKQEPDQKVAEQHEDPKRTKSEDLVDSVEALRDFRCLVQFMDLELKDMDRFAKADLPTRILFRDLWHLFKPGDQVFVPLRSGSGEDHGRLEPSSTISQNQNYQVSWRVLSTWGGRPNLSAEDDAQVSIPKQKINPFELYCYYIDYNGKIFVPSPHTWRIKPFQGERDITSLEVYPWRYAKDYVRLRSSLKDRGQKFQDLLTLKYRFYKGSTLVCQPCGCGFLENCLPSYPEQIESEVVVDFREAVRENSNLRPYIRGTTTTDCYEKETVDGLAVSVWKDDKQEELENEKYDVIYDDSLVDAELSIDFENKDPLLKEDPDPDFTSGKSFRDEDLMLLPARVLGYVFRKQHFAALDIENLQPIVKPYTRGWKDLKLSTREHKDMLKALVKNHLSEKESKALHPEQEHEYDIVRGKGQGVIVLLHGVPGVGKTSTAECVAESYSKPLLQITCGDLGLTAESVEKELDNKFHLASTWDCVLLLDEADVFLAQRTKQDLQRNALVSVFLRVLEYYTGILFLTTNRVGAFDDAFKSRIHLSLYYPPLDQKQTLSIWKMNLERTLARKSSMTADKKEIMSYAKSHYQMGQQNNTAWNGRQIRNAFQTATALAEFEARERHSKDVKKGKKEDSAPVYSELKSDYFKTVAQASFDFDKYLEGINDETLAERAQRVAERNDRYQSTDLTSGRPRSGASRSKDESILETDDPEQFETEKRTRRQGRSGTNRRQDSAQNQEPWTLHPMTSDPRRSQQMHYSMTPTYGMRYMDPILESQARQNSLPQERYPEPFQRPAQISPERPTFQKAFRRESYSDSDSDSDSDSEDD